jgi:hypothetical protein
MYLLVYKIRYFIINLRYFQQLVQETSHGRIVLSKPKGLFNRLIFPFFSLIPHSTSKLLFFLKVFVHDIPCFLFVAIFIEQAFAVESLLVNLVHASQ